MCTSILPTSSCIPPNAPGGGGSGIGNWQDIPASYHNGSCGFSFADGHSEIKKWLSRDSRYQRVTYGYPATLEPFTADTYGRVDFAWYLERTGFVDPRTGRRDFGY